MYIYVGRIPYCPSPSWLYNLVIALYMEVEYVRNRMNSSRSSYLHTYIYIYTRYIYVSSELRGCVHTYISIYVYGLFCEPGILRLRQRYQRIYSICTLIHVCTQLGTHDIQCSCEIVLIYMLGNHIHTYIYIYIYIPYIHNDATCSMVASLTPSAIKASSTTPLLVISLSPRYEVLQTVARPHILYSILCLVVTSATGPIYGIPFALWAKIQVVIRTYVFRAKVVCCARRVGVLGWHRYRTPHRNSRWSIGGAVLCAEYSVDIAYVHDRS